MTELLNISVIIPTKDRTESLNRTLLSIYSQTLLPKEIIIVESNEVKLTKNEIPEPPNDLSIIIERTQPSVCTQRNIGIKISTGKYILLCDDDIEISKNYISELANYLNKQNEVDIVSGIILEKNKDEQWVYHQNRILPLKLFFRYLFGLSVWSPVNKNIYPQWYLKSIVNYYVKLDNNITRAGWPVVSNFENDVIVTRIYGLGISMVRAKKLKKNPFDPAFVHDGIGDNYDLALRINKSKKIHVLKSVEAYHHKEIRNRMSNINSFFYRCEALNYILHKREQSFLRKNRFSFFWSMIGNTIYFLGIGNLQMTKASFKVLKNIIKKL
jgi:glycosyltransferase involved in cell wall biosynthesis